MTSMTRRQFAAMASALGFGLAFAKAGAFASPLDWDERRDLYPQGVASGDPQADSVVLWTRRPPAGAEPPRRLTVEVAPDPDFNTIVARGAARIDAATDWTGRFLVGGLEPGREYFYRFVDEQGFGSRVGRTRTAPAEDADAPARFAFVSCQDPTSGAMNAWRRMIFDDRRKAPADQLDFVLHLGDFIYEVVWYPEDSPNGVQRGRRLRPLFRYPNGEKIRDFHLPATLEDYRTAYRAYLTDPDIQDARARWPFVCVWDNHEFSWQGWQSQQVFGGEVRPGQTRKVMANQAWWEYQPGRYRQPGGSLERFNAPRVTDAPVERFDALGLGLEPNNLAAIESLGIDRALRWGRNLELILTDNHSYRSPPPDGGAFAPREYRWMQPQEAIEILDQGRAHGGGNPPATIRYGGRNFPNPSRDKPPQSHLGTRQKAWFLDRLRQSTAAWKVWGHSFGTLVWRTDIHNLPEEVAPAPWPGAGYAVLNAGFLTDRAEICDTIRREGITGFAIVAGDKHSFWAGFVSKDLPPQPFDPVGVEFITGSISSQGLFEVAEEVMPRDEPLRALFLHDRPDGSVAPAMNMTVLHGVRSALELQRSGDVDRALALSNPEVAPHLRFADLGGHGFGVVHATGDRLETEFVCIPRPYEKASGEDGGPIAYRVVHRVDLWREGQTPQLTQEIVEGRPPLAT